LPLPPEPAVDWSSLEPAMDMLTLAFFVGEVVSSTEGARAPASAFPVAGGRSARSKQVSAVQCAARAARNELQRAARPSAVLRATSAQRASALLARASRAAARRTRTQPTAKRTGAGG